MDPRTLWQLYEPYHAITYFAPESAAAYEAAGLRGFWRGYFAGRAAPMGRVEPAVVVAAFYGFRPDFVARAIPSVWELASPESAIAARLAGADAALRRVLGDDITSGAIAETADLAQRAIATCDPGGRTLFAANLDLEWPQTPHLTLWHATTLLREHRGDGHVLSLVHAELDGCEANVLRIADAGEPVDTIKPYRGWTDADWSSATTRLRARGLLDDRGSITDAGRSLRARVEDDTDRLAMQPLRALGVADTERLGELLRTITVRLTGEGTIPYPNPIGVGQPSS